VSRLYADLLAAESRIADLEARLAAATHDAVVARDRAEVAEGILRKLTGVVWMTSGTAYLRGAGVDLTDAEAALFDTINPQEETPNA
jgi:hypothetical protein